MAVYFIRAADDTGPIKIGHTNGPVKSRLSGLQVSSPAPLKILKTIDGDHEYEEAIHQRFSHLRVSGEWFEAAPELLSFIDNPVPLTVRKRQGGFRIIRDPAGQWFRDLDEITNQLDEAERAELLAYANSLLINGVSNGKSQPV